MFIKAIHTIHRDPKAKPPVIEAGKVFHADLISAKEVDYLLRPDVRAAVEATDDDLIKAGLKAADEDHEADARAAAEAAAKEAADKVAAEAAEKEAAEAAEKAAAETAEKEAADKAAAEAAEKEAAKKKGGKKAADDESLV